MSPAQAFNSKPGNGKHLILVVDDEPGMREFLSLYLRSKNFQVLLAADPVAATEHWEKHRGKIELLLTDVVMPNMNGKELADLFLKECPDLKVIFMSGFLPQDLPEEDLPFPVFKKPFHPSDLLKTIHELLH